MDDKTTQEIRRLIAEIATQEIDKVIPNVEMVYDGVVDYYTTINDDGTETKDTSRLVVKVKGEQYDVSSREDNKGVYMHNPYSVSLEQGMAVRINAKGGNLHNAYINIGYKKSE